MKIGLLGAGRIGAFHAGVLAEHEDVDDLVVGDLDAGRAAAVAEEVGGRSGTIEEVIGSGLEAAVIAAATSAHAELINACLDEGLPTFCEKPVALGYEETVAIVDRVESSGAILQVGFMRRFDAGYREAKRLVDAGALGTLYSMHMFGHDHEPPPEGYIPQSGGIFRDLHIHEFDVLRWLTGSGAEEVFARGSVRKFGMFAKYDDYDTSAAVIRMADGVLAVLTGSRHDPSGYDVRMEIFGSEDSVCVGLNERTPLRSVEPGVVPPEGPPYPGFLVRFEQAYRDELAHFIDLVGGRAGNPCTAHDSLEALRIAIAAEVSIAENRPVSLKEIG
jgi:myo-inositol 2-dehydrogenase / D-chiro-inositol 1-dehydrogenase